jgi:formylmethanofuran dehydrogenase subunit E|tara:strand:+ start:827 stop:1096 length:270 start_codon:yes stop_codon:yes gene_type:complete
MIDKDHLMEILEEEECLTADGFDDALVGCTYGANVVAVYDINKMIEILMEEGTNYDDAVEFLDYNVVGAYLGEKTPLYINFVTEEVHND